MAPESAVLQSWVLKELAFWKAKSPRRDLVLSELERLNRRHASIFLFEIADGTVRTHPKPELSGEAHALAAYEKRVKWYSAFLLRVLAKYRMNSNLFMGIDMADVGLDNTEIPIFSFQKHRSSKNVLLPDVDFFKYDFYRSTEYIDEIEFKEKKNRAFFVGSTTGGGTITLDKLNGDLVPRIRAARYFRGNNLVVFTVARLVQCESREVASAILSLGIKSNVVTWQEQFQNKGLISIDGNGATCSRVVIALKSNSALLKYESYYMLYWFDGLVPWFHYIPISSDDDVEKAIELECREPGALEIVARNGTKFYEDYLTEERVMDYAARLLTEYERIFFK